MGELPAPLAYLLLSWGVVTAVLAILMIYNSVLSNREEDQLFLSKGEEGMLAEQQQLIARMERIKKFIVALAVVSAVLLFAAGGLWVWIGFTSA